ncbi:MAG: calcium/sodium antiporter [Bacteroidales bacterium]|nr:calcium/sodium antiporter [Bacteroidales bacterium]
MEYLQLVGGFLLLICGANFLVKGGVQIALRYQLPPLLIGMTIVAFGTSAPEFIVSLSAALKGNSGIALGNVIGSNIVNIGLILGLTALFSPIPVNKKNITVDALAMVIASVAFLLALKNGIINRTEGAIGFLSLILYNIYMFRRGKKEGDSGNIGHPHTAKLWVSVCYVIGACIALAYGADILVNGATSIAKTFGVSDRIIGITIVAFGTSLPELATSLVAALKKESDISIGNIIGSNFFNITGVIGLSSLISPISGDFPAFRNDLLWMIGFSILLILLIYPLRKNIKSMKNKPSGVKTFLNFEGGKLGRLSGATILLLYFIYLIFLF